MPPPTLMVISECVFVTHYLSIFDGVMSQALMEVLMMAGPRYIFQYTPVQDRKRSAHVHHLLLCFSLRHRHQKSFFSRLLFQEKVVTYSIK